MSVAHNSPLPWADSGPRPAPFSRFGLFLCLAVVAFSLTVALSLPKSYSLAWIGDTLQTALLAAFVVLSFQNLLRSRGQVRGFWTMIFLGAAIWLGSQLVWSTYELVFRISVPDSAFADSLLIAKLVPFTAAIALEPHRPKDSRFRTFGWLDLSILILYALYIFAFFVYANRLLSPSLALYDSSFNVADGVGNFLFAFVTVFAYFRERGPWRSVYALLFLSALTYGISSTLNDIAIDQGRYYTGSLYDILLLASMASFIWTCLAGRHHLHSGELPSGASRASTFAPRLILLSSHLAMLVTLSAPAIGLWLLTAPSSSPLFSFRLALTLLTMFFLTLLLSIKQDLLSASLFTSLQHLSHTYSSIDRFKDHLVQSEKLATLGESVARVANEISDAMMHIREQSARITSHPGADPRSISLASKIGQYAQRTDSLAENMQRFAQESPLQLASVELKPLLETALHLSRIAKLPNLRFELVEQSPTPPVLADSSQLLHVFLQIISNAMDALQEAGGGDLLITIRPCDPQVCIQFADNGPGIEHPARVFEPFFTTKPVGKGTGLGLSTCYGIIRQHNGDISCGNRLEGGAYFTVFLPAATLRHDEPAESAPLAVEEAP